VLLAPPLFNPNFGGVPVAPDRRGWASTSAWTLSYLAVKLFSKNSNLCENHTSTSQTDRQTDRQTTYCRITALCVASRGKNFSSEISKLWSPKSLNVLCVECLSYLVIPHLNANCNPKSATWVNGDGDRNRQNSHSDPFYNM